jgi:hypothetical protein
MRLVFSAPDRKRVGICSASPPLRQRKIGISGESAIITEQLLPALRLLPRQDSPIHLRERACLPFVHENFLGRRQNGISGMAADILEEIYV